MSYVIVNVETHRAYGKRGYSVQRYATLPAAKAAVTRLSKKSSVVYEPMESEHYQILVGMTTVMVERTNLMSGLEYLEAEDTPLCCSPASETYWSM